MGIYNYHGGGSVVFDDEEVLRAWFLRCKEAGEKAGEKAGVPLPRQEQITFTNFIR